MDLDDIDHRLNSLCHLPKINNRRLNLRQTKALSLLHVVIDLCRMDQGLGWNAAKMEAVSAQTGFFLNEQCLCSQLCCT